MLKSEKKKLYGLSPENSPMGAIFSFLRQKKSNNYSCLVPHCASPPPTEGHDPQ